MRDDMNGQQRGTVTCMYSMSLEMLMSYELTVERRRRHGDRGPGRKATGYLDAPKLLLLLRY